MSGLGTAIAMIRSLNNNAKLSTKKRHPNVFELKSRMEGVSSQHNYPTVSEQKRMELVEAGGSTAGKAQKIHSQKHVDRSGDNCGMYWFNCVLVIYVYSC